MEGENVHVVGLSDGSGWVIMCVLRPHGAIYYVNSALKIPDRAIHDTATEKNVPEAYLP